MFNNTMGMMAMMDDLMGLVKSLSNEVISARVRTRALLELLEEKGLLAPGEFDERAAAVWERDYDELAEELMGQGDVMPDIMGDDAELD